MRYAIACLVMLLVASCGTSPKTRYFTLSGVPGANRESARIATPVTVASVHIPPSLDRREIVRRTGPNTVDIDEQNRWTAPLGEMIRRVLSEDLAARLPEGKVIPPDAPVPPRTAQIAVAIAAFGFDAGGTGSDMVTLDGSWSLLQGAPAKPVLRREVRLETGAAGPSPGKPAAGNSGTGNSDAGGQAAAMSQLLGQLADRIAATLSEAAPRAQSAARPPP